MELGISRLLKQVDQEWLDLDKEQADDSSFWLFHELARKETREERFVVTEEHSGPMAVWLDHNRLVNTNAYRLDYFKVRPDMQGKGLGRFVLGLVGLRALEKQAERLVFQSLPKAVAFYQALGAIECTDWRGEDGALKNLQVGTEALRALERIVDGYRIQQ